LPLPAPDRGQGTGQRDQQYADAESRAGGRRTSPRRRRRDHGRSDPTEHRLDGPERRSDPPEQVARRHLLPKGHRTGIRHRPAQQHHRHEDRDQRDLPGQAQAGDGDSRRRIGTDPGVAEPDASGALLDRLPNLRLDPDAPPPGLIGMYERGATEIPVLFG
jgi:hypothetical protein